MNIKLYRYSIQDQTTLGFITLDDKFKCYTLENSLLKIPTGKYKIGYRKTGGFHKKYSKRFFSIHEGMLEIKNVKGRKYILIHTGNKIEDTKGCILVGNSTNNNLIRKGFIEDSRNAYVKLYTLISSRLEKKEEVTIEIKNI